MKYICPHCNKDGLSFFSKLSSGLANPAKCKYCDGLSSISGAVLSLFSVFIYTLILFAAGYAFVKQTWLPLIGAIIVYITLQALIVLYSPLVPLTKESVKNHRYFLLIFIIVFIAVGYFGSKK